jgi:hypothetical protein
VRKAYVTVYRTSKDESEKCDGHHEPEKDGRWEVYTPVDTGDGYRIACDECLADWVDTVMKRIEDDEGNILTMFLDD